MKIENIWKILKTRLSPHERQLPFLEHNLPFVFQYVNALFRLLLIMVTSLRKSAKQNLYMVKPAITNVVLATHGPGHLHPNVITGAGHKVVFTVEVRHFLKPCSQ